MEPIQVTTEIKNAELLLARAESKARELLAEAAIREEKNHRIRLEENQKTIIETMEKTVNGKVNALKKTVEDYIAVDTDWKKKDLEWKNTATPAVSFVNNATFWSSWLGKHFIMLMKFIILVGAVFGAYTVIYNFFIK